MKSLIFALTLAIAPVFAHAFGPEVCEPDARLKIQGDVDAYASLAEKYPNEDVWKKYLSCKGQKVQLISATPLTGYMRPTYNYQYSVQCGANTLTFGTSFYVERGCVILGE